MRKVAIGPRGREARHQIRPLRPFACASPALIKMRVPHPTKYAESWRMLFPFLWEDALQEWDAPPNGSAFSGQQRR
jgi:hypothetical protein